METIKIISNLRYLMISIPIRTSGLWHSGCLQQHLKPECILSCTFAYLCIYCYYFITPLHDLYLDDIYIYIYMEIGDI